MRAALGAAGRAGLSVACRPWTARRGYACAPAMRCDGAESARSAPTSSLVRDFANALRAHEVVRPGDRVVVCVSGGADSVALLHLLSEVREEWRLDLHVLHFDHRRRAESAEERAFVEALGARLRAEVHVRVPDSPFADASFQANARSWRRSEARALLERVDAHVILQGHHADDQTETILLKLFRGCHLSKVAGMAHREGVFGRPLLDCPKSALISYLEARSEPWREDASNADEAYLRNRVRHDLVPALRGVTHGSLEDRLRALTAQSAHLREWLDDVPKATVPGAFGTRSDVGELDLDVWFALPTMAREDQLYDYVERSTANRLGYRNLRKIMPDALDERGMELAPENDWELVRVGRARSRGRLRPSPSSRPRPATTRVRRRQSSRWGGGSPCRILRAGPCARFGTTTTSRGTSSAALGMESASRIYPRRVRWLCGIGSPAIDSARGRATRRFV